MKNRREFLRLTALTAPLLAALPGSLRGSMRRGQPLSAAALGQPCVVSTWSHGVAANGAAWEVLAAGGRALDAVEAGVRVSEADPEIQSVGLGGLPDRQGHVTLDASIMDEHGDCGSVAFLEHIKHPISVARLVMQETPHVMLVGEGALRFALTQGFEKENLLTEAAEKAWREWLRTSGSPPPVDERQHDTISMLALDARGRLSGACTTSGVAFKMHGRVGDSPIIGAALFVDPQVGAACATGLGEEVLKTVGSFLVVELMRRGASPAAACREAVQRIVQRQARETTVQVGYLALSVRGEVGAYCIQPGFDYAVQDASVQELRRAESWR